MNNLHFNDLKDATYSFAEKYEEISSIDELDDIVIVAKYEEAKKIIEELVYHGYGISEINLNSVQVNHYEKEFAITLMFGSIGCLPLYENGDYIDVECDNIFLMDNCAARIIKHLKGKNIFDVSIDDEIENEHEDDECGCYCDGCPGFDECFGSKSEETDLSSDDKHEVKNLRETYKVNGKEVSKDEYDKVVRRIEDNYSDILSSYAEFMADLHNWHKMLGL